MCKVSSLCRFKFLRKLQKCGGNFLWRRTTHGTKAIPICRSSTHSSRHKNHNNSMETLNDLDRKVRRAKNRCVSYFPTLPNFSSLQTCTLEFFSPFSIKSRFFSHRVKKNYKKKNKNCTFPTYFFLACNRKRTYFFVWPNTL